MNQPTNSNSTVVVEKEMPHPPEKIWRALTQASLMEAWLLANDFEAVVGHKFKFRNKPIPQWDGLIDCEVLLIEPNHRISYSWNALGLNSVVAWTLTPIAGGTRVRMEHSGFSSEESAAYKGASYGWRKFIGNLELIVADTDDSK